MKHLDPKPTAELQEFLRDKITALDTKARVQFNHLLDDLDRQMDWYYSQNQLNKGRVEWLKAELRLSHGWFWRGVEALVLLCNKIAEAGRQQRQAAIALEREREQESR